MWRLSGEMLAEMSGMPRSGLGNDIASLFYDFIVPEHLRSSYCTRLVPLLMFYSRLHCSWHEQGATMLYTLREHWQQREAPVWLVQASVWLMWCICGARHEELTSEKKIWWTEILTCLGALHTEINKRKGNSHKSRFQSHFSSNSHRSHTTWLCCISCCPFLVISMFTAILNFLFFYAEWMSRILWPWMSRISWLRCITRLLSFQCRPLHQRKNCPVQYLHFFICCTGTLWNFA